MFHHHDDYKFKKIIDDFILTSVNDPKSSYNIKNIDYQATKLGISFYQMMFILIQKDVIENRKKQKKCFGQKIREILMIFM
jgi:hypothetical protein